MPAVGGDVGSNVTYVWDIIDQSGNRVLRFSGIEIAGAAGNDPWNSGPSKQPANDPWAQQTNSEPPF